MRSTFTIGHSNHSLEHFMELLRQHAVTAVADVRSTPYSRMNPQYNREDLKAALAAAGITYVFLGKELGARSDDPACYEGGKVQYDRIARTEFFRRGLERVKEGCASFRLALMCAEREPLDCHRTILIARHLLAQGIDVEHIHSDGRIESHGDAICRLITLLKMPQESLFQAREEIVEDAYKRQEERIAYVSPPAKDVDVDTQVGPRVP